MKMGANHPAMAQMADNPKQRFRIVLLRLPGPSFFAVPFPPHGLDTGKNQWLA